MRLIRLSLTNFRQHADTELEFRTGLTGIIGPNGAGKSTILEAIAWAIYGSQALRGTVDTIRFNRAPGRSRVAVELEFELGGERYRIVRSARNAELYRDDGKDPIAAGISEVTRQLTRRLGMSRDEFFNTYFTGQKELQFLAAMKPNARRLFLSRVLGYERLRDAQNLAREQRNVLKGQVEELRRGLGDEAEVARAVDEAERKLSEASAALAEHERTEVKAAERFAQLEPAWMKSQAERERDRQLNEELRVLQARLEGAEESLKKAEAELAELDDVRAEMDALRERAAPLAGLSGEEENLRRLAQSAAERVALEKQLEEQRERIEALAEKHAKLEATIEKRGDLATAAATREEDRARLEAERDRIRADWQRDRQDVDARLRMLLDQAEELKKQVEQIEEAGPDGICQACRRPLGAEYDRVLGDLRLEYDGVIADGKWHRKREEQLAEEPPEVAAADAGLASARKELDRIRGELAGAEAARSQFEALATDLENEKTRARKLAGTIALIPEGYDAARHDEVRRRLEELKELEKKITQLEARLEAEKRLKVEAAEAAEELRQRRADIAELERARAEVGFAAEQFESLGKEFESARATLDLARLDAERARGELEWARGAADSARKAEDDLRKLSQLIREREKEHRLHNELDAALGALRDELNDRVRPELSEIASVFLTELTDGRYNQIEIGQDYEIVVLDAGQEKPVISGGEEDLANLVLRLAISQMIADRAGHTLSLLIFDEVFGSLDEQRRESVVRLLQKLQDRFEQVVLITHIESIREGMDQVVRVAYDEESGASVMCEESPEPGDAEPELEALVQHSLIDTH